jgi:hypothetical protein
MFDNITTTEETETIVKRSMTIVLSEDEATAALVNPAKLLKRIRGERAKWHARPAWSATGHADSRPRKSKKATEKKSGKAAKQAKPAAAGAEQKCPHCHYSFKRLAKHLPSCPERPSEVQPPADD